MKKNDFNYLLINNSQYLELLYEDYLSSPENLSVEWQQTFKDLSDSPDSRDEKAIDQLEFWVLKLIYSYRSRGHYLTKTNPIKPQKDCNPALSLQEHNLSEADLDREFFAGNFLNLGKTSLRNIIARLQEIYCQNIGLECMHMHRVEMRRWLRDRFENRQINFSEEKKKKILSKLNEAVVFENFLNSKFVGQKRFSLEGAENTLPALDAIMQKALEYGVREVVIGMAHRGRLNILANLIGKTYEFIFKEFEGSIDPETTMGNGDVKYHLGYTSKYENEKGLTLKLMPNPSHLEAVGPTVLGFARALGDRFYQRNRKLVLPLLIHGDAALAGQGVVYESIQMARLRGFYVGGCIHFVINNQIGFTTDFDEARSSHYCTGIAKVIDVPVIHVNGDDAEAVVFAVELASEFRQHFGEEIFVDMLCYRRHGHNEGDEPKYTQPELYEIINSHPDPRSLYVKKLVAGEELDQRLAGQLEKDFRQLLQDRLNLVKENKVEYRASSPPEHEWKTIIKSETSYFEKKFATAISPLLLDSLKEIVTALPSGVEAIVKAQKILQQRNELWDRGECDWAMGELLAYASLLKEGKHIRLCGQDTIRGTFSHRHAHIYDQRTKSFVNIFRRLEEGENISIYNSILSEYAVLGYEYGYSLVSPHTLCLWEAQFGDFANGAQIIIDQFIASAETKWQQMSGLVLLLPHGYEGQGPEHSSARLERFLQLCAEDNMVIANCTTPANLFHLLRRQLIWPIRKPLILFSPKSLFRHPRCLSPLRDFSEGSFLPLIDDPAFVENSSGDQYEDHSYDHSYDTKAVKSIAFCSGKIYYDLLEYRKKVANKSVALIRIEQLYPFPSLSIQTTLKKYPNVERKLWVQEAPKNAEAYGYLLLNQYLPDLELVSREAAASPATGIVRIHQQELANILKKVFL
ncbi:MAG: 2-oxoglutarate dehydrogenase E1 component [Oligoflexia bacterium]|nr:2-oxoglutarate dehydrogenase E1 component [Oligoflexia bacterium]